MFHLSIVNCLGVEISVIKQLNYQERLAIIFYYIDYFTKQHVAVTKMNQGASMKKGNHKKY